MAQFAFNVCRGVLGITWTGIPQYICGFNALNQFEEMAIRERERREEWAARDARWAAYDMDRCARNGDYFGFKMAEWGYRNACDKLGGIYINQFGVTPDVMKFIESLSKKEVSFLTNRFMDLPDIAPFNEPIKNDRTGKMRTISKAILPKVNPITKTIIIDYRGVKYHIEPYFDKFDATVTMNPFSLETAVFLDAILNQCQFDFGFSLDNPHFEDNHTKHLHQPKWIPEILYTLTVSQILLHTDIMMKQMMDTPVPIKSILERYIEKVPPSSVVMVRCFIKSGDVILDVNKITKEVKVKDVPIMVDFEISKHPTDPARSKILMECANEWKNEFNSKMDEICKKIPEFNTLKRFYKYFHMIRLLTTHGTFNKDITDNLELSVNPYYFMDSYKGMSKEVEAKVRRINNCVIGGVYLGTHPINKSPWRMADLTSEFEKKLACVHCKWLLEPSMTHHIHKDGFVCDDCKSKINIVKLEATKEYLMAIDKAIHFKGSVSTLYPGSTKTLEEFKITDDFIKALDKYPNIKKYYEAREIYINNNDNLIDLRFLMGKLFHISVYLTTHCSAPNIETFERNLHWLNKGVGLFEWKKENVKDGLNIWIKNYLDSFQEIQCYDLTKDIDFADYDHYCKYRYFMCFNTWDGEFKDSNNYHLKVSDNMYKFIEEIINTSVKSKMDYSKWYEKDKNIKFIMNIDPKVNLVINNKKTVLLKGFICHICDIAFNNEKINKFSGHIHEFLCLNMLVQYQIKKIINDFLSAIWLVKYKDKYPMLKDELELFRHNI